MIFGLILVFAGVAWIEIPGLIRKRDVRELAVFSLFFLSAFLLALLQVLGVNLPDPMDFVHYLIKDLLRLNYK